MLPVGESLLQCCKLLEEHLGWSRESSWEATSMVQARDHKVEIMAPLKYRRENEN